jgi:hypothetical protein
MRTSKHELTRIHQGLTRAATEVPYYPRWDGYIASERDAKRDPTPVPAGLFASLVRLARSLGYPVHQRYTSDELGALGHTLVGHVIDIAADMNEAARCRVLIHEIGHALTRGYLAQIGGENFEEVAVESASAIVCGALGTSNGVFATRFCASKSGQSRYMMAAAEPFAVELAQVILKGIGHEVTA